MLNSTETRYLTVGYIYGFSPTSLRVFVTKRNLSFLVVSYRASRKSWSHSSIQDFSISKPSINYLQAVFPSGMLDVTRLTSGKLHQCGSVWSVWNVWQCGAIPATFSHNLKFLPHSPHHPQSGLLLQMGQVIHYFWIDNNSAIILRDNKYMKTASKCEILSTNTR